MLAGKYLSAPDRTALLNNIQAMISRKTHLQEVL
jgi:hypothetical protein